MSTNCNQNVEEVRAVLESLAGNNRAAIESGLKLCTRKIRHMNSMLKAATSVAEKKHIASCVALTQGFRCMMKGLLRISGGALTDTKKNLPHNAKNHVKWVDQQSGFSGRMRTGVVVNLTHKDPTKFMEDAFVLFRRRINNALKKEAAIKVNSAFCGDFKVVKKDEELYEFKYMTTKNSAIYKDTDIKEWFNVNVLGPVLKQLEEFQERDSGWALDTIINITFNMNKFTPLLGSSYIDMPPEINNKKACINVKNNDEACFAWAVTSALYPASKHSDRTSSYPHYSQVLNLRNITFPMTSKQIPRFETQNNVSINLYTLEQHGKNFTVNPTYLTKNKQPKHVNLLVVQSEYYDEKEESYGEDECIKYHYVWVKNLSRLVSKQLSNMNGQKYFCDRCLHYFYTNEKLQQHVNDCEKMNYCRVRLPAEDKNIVQFKNHSFKEMAPFVVYADIECLLEPTKTKNVYQQHIPYSIGYYVKCSYDDSLSFYKSYRGADCQRWFTSELKQFAEDVETVFLCPLPMEPLTSIQLKEFAAAKSCHICNKTFNAEDVKVKDHNHLNSRYRGAAHENCNLNYQDTHIIPVIFHNLSGYDSHFIIKNLAKDFEGRVDLLPINKERYISFTKHVDDNIVKFRFLDSFRFMASGLDKLAASLTEAPILKSVFSDLTPDQLKMLSRKGVFPYDHISDISRLEETHLPEQKLFYNQLNDSHITDKDYAHAQEVWTTFKCNTLGEYADLYLKTDILLLTDVFEQFRLSCLKTYELDPAHCYTLPGFTWEAMLKHTGIKLELLTDIDQVMFIERGIRGGLSQCSKRYAAANNKYMTNYDPNKPSKYLAYFDINNQYGWAMSQYLPYGGFQWVEDVENLDFAVADDADEGYILEVYLEYPPHLHDQHKDLPFCPVHEAPPGSKEEKLLATLEDKEKYIIHYRNLKQALHNGLILKKIHRALKFKQSPWLKSYIDLNTRLRQAATTDFEKNLFKLMNNAVFGKTMENVRKHSVVKLVTRWEGRYGAEALISKPQFKSSTIFEENLAAIELNKSEIFINKPIYIGLCILEISKLKIYDFHYVYMKSRFGDKATICYTDTDSLIYEIETSDLYEIIRSDANEYFDTSDFPADNKFNIPLVNKKVLGLMKEEHCGEIMSQFIGLRSKMYAVRVEGEDRVKKAKGVKSCVVKNKITFNDYLDCLYNNKELSVSQNRIQSTGHIVSTIHQHKIALSPHDNKRYLTLNSAETLPHGHYSIMLCD